MTDHIKPSDDPTGYPFPRKPPPVVAGEPVPAPPPEPEAPDADVE